jgi:DNA repair protein RadA/Sms
MAKSESIFLCNSCGNEFSKWSGQCPACGDWNTLREATGLITGPKRGRARPASLVSSTHKLTQPREVLTQRSKLTWPTKITEFDRVLGPGLTAGGVYLLAGEPGIGKSTILTQLTIEVSAQKRRVLYVCAEESPAQVATRIDRLSKQKFKNEHIFLLGTSAIEAVLETLTKPQEKGAEFALVIVDSIQTVATSLADGQAGTPSQIRACTNLLSQVAKDRGIPLILVGHVTKAGTVAGPKLLEHMVDAVLQLEGDRHYDLRLLRGVKNRFGPTDETGLFQMTSSGLESITDPNAAFLTEADTPKPGSAISLIMEGTRPLTVEIQALTVASELAIPRRVAQGVPLPRLQLICAILTKHLNLKLGTVDVFVNITSGLSLREPAADLAIALAIYSSYKNIPLPAKSVAIGELGLLGEIRPVPFLDKRLKQAKTLGFKRFFTPEDKSLKQIKL